jgi:hypothetical protein
MKADPETILMALNALQDRLDFLKRDVFAALAERIEALDHDLTAVERTASGRPQRPRKQPHTWTPAMRRAAAQRLRLRCKRGDFKPKSKKPTATQKKPAKAATAGR